MHIIDSIYKCEVKEIACICYSTTKSMCAADTSQSDGTERFKLRVQQVNTGH